MHTYNIQAKMEHIYLVSVLLKLNSARKSHKKKIFWLSWSRLLVCRNLTGWWIWDRTSPSLVIGHFWSVLQETCTVNGSWWCRICGPWARYWAYLEKASPFTLHYSSKIKENHKVLIFSPLFLYSLLLCFCASSS